MVLLLLAAVMYVVFLGLHGAWAHTFGYLFVELSHVRIGGQFFGGVHPFGFLGSLNVVVANNLLKGAQGSQHSMGYFFHGAAVIQGWLARETLALSRDTLGWARWLQHVHLPKYVRYALYAAFPPALLAKLIQAHALPRIIHEGKTITIKARVDWSRVKRIAEAAVATAIGLSLPHVHILPRINLSERWHGLTRKRLRRLEALLAATGALALVARAFKKAGLECLLGRNGRTLGKELCKVDPSLFASLFVDGLVIASGISVVTFAKELLAIEDEAVKILGAGIREFPG